MDKFLEKIQNPNDAEDSKFFTKSSFMITLMDLMQAGADTSANTLAYAVLFLSKCPDIQSKLFQEVENVIGNGNRADLSHQEKYEQNYH